MAMMIVALVRVSTASTKRHDQGKSLFPLFVGHTVHHQGKSGQKLKKVTERQELLTGLLLIACSACFLIDHNSPGMVPPQMSCALRKCPIDLPIAGSYEGVFLS